MNLSALLLLAQAATPAPGAPPPGGNLVMIGQLVLIMVIFYFLLIRPQQKKTKEHQKLVAGIQTGDDVITSAGIHGVVTNVKDKTVLVRVADNVRLEFDRAAIVSVSRESEKSS